MGTAETDTTTVTINIMCLYALLNIIYIIFLLGPMTSELGPISQNHFNYNYNYFEISTSITITITPS